MKYAVLIVALLCALITTCRATTTKQTLSKFDKTLFLIFSVLFLVIAISMFVGGII
jgi:hypothetical protein